MITKDACAHAAAGLIRKKVNVFDEVSTTIEVIVGNEDSSQG